MVRRSWESIRAFAWNAHLVVALLPDEFWPTHWQSARTPVELLSELIVTLRITRDYAVTMGDDAEGTTEGTPEAMSVQCAFEDEYDAARLADTVLATQTPADGWASRRIFELDQPVVEAIEAALARLNNGEER